MFLEHHQVNNPYFFKRLIVLVHTWYCTNKWNKICLSTSNLQLHWFWNFAEFQSLPGIFAVLLGKQANSTGDSIFAAPPSGTVSIPHRHARNWLLGLPAPGPEQDCREPSLNGPARPEAGCAGDGRWGQPGYLRWRLPRCQCCCHCRCPAAAAAAHVLLEWRLAHDKPATCLCKRKARMIPSYSPPYTYTSSIIVDEALPGPSFTCR